MLELSVIFPVESNVSVSSPTLAVAVYVLVSPKRFSNCFVPEPIPMIMRPSANGSRAPEWPIFILGGKFFFNSLMQSKELMPIGFLIKSNPFILAFLSFFLFILRYFYQDCIGFWMVKKKILC